MIKIFTCVLLVATSVFCMDTEISFVFDKGNVSSKKEKYVKIFPTFKDLLESNSELSYISINFSQEVFNQWFKLVEEIAVKGKDSYKLPTNYSLALEEKIHLQLKNQNVILAQDFINAGDYLEMPEDLMNCISDFFSDKISDTNLKKEFTISNQATQQYFKNMLKPINNMFILSNKLLNVNLDTDFLIASLNNKYVSSEKNSFIAYIHSRKDRNNVNVKKYYIYFVDILKKENKATIQQHVVDLNAKNKQALFIKCAAQEPCFLTITPYDDRILIHHLKDRQQNRFINLDLADNYRVTCCDISANGNSVVVGYENGKNNKFVVYDKNGGISCVIPTQNNEGFLGCICNPSDSSTGILTTSGSNKQYTAMLENNISKIPFTQGKEFLQNDSLYNVQYNSSGKYIFALKTVQDSENVVLYRLPIILLDSRKNEFSLPITPLEIMYVPDLYSNDEGDIVVFKFHDKKHKDNIIVVNCVNGTVYSIPGDNLISCVIKGYLLVYIESKTDKKELVFFDTLYAKEISRQEVDTDYNKIIDLTNDFKLIVQRGLVSHRAANNRAYVMQKISLINIINPSCLKEITTSLQTYNFLPGDENWFTQINVLLNAIKDKSIDSFQQWFNNVEFIFSEDFRELLVKCGFVVLKEFQEAKKLVEYVQQIKQDQLDMQKKDVAKITALQKQTKEREARERLLEIGRDPVSQNQQVQSVQDQQAAPLPALPQPAPTQNFIQRAWSTVKTVVNDSVNFIVATIVTPLFRWIGFI